MTPAKLHGIFAAALTPLRPDGSPDLEAMPRWLSFLAARGCHGALILGTTGEGPSFSPVERAAILGAAAQVRQEYPDFRLLAGTGTPSLDETIELTRTAFELGADAVVVLPPYYFRKASDDGLFAWFSQVIERAVPQDRALLGYHIPGMTGVPLSLDLLGRLAEAYPGRFAGLKDSSGDPEHARLLGKTFGADLTVLNGNDRLLSLALENQAAGCITAGANLISPLLRQVWDAFQAGASDAAAQARADTARSAMDGCPPAPPLLKAAAHRLYGLPSPEVRLPLCPSPPECVEQLLAALQAAGQNEPAGG